MDDRWFVTFTFNPIMHPMRKPETYVVGHGASCDGNGFTLDSDSWIVFNHHHDSEGAIIKVVEFDRYELTGIFITQER